MYTESQGLESSFTAFSGTKQGSLQEVEHLGNEQAHVGSWHLQGENLAIEP